MRLAGRVALVTGASRGIGKAIALAFAREGADLAIVGRSSDALCQVQSSVANLGRRCVLIVEDLVEPGACERVFDRCRADLGRVDILMNAAGVGSSAGPAAVADFDDRLWELTLRLNLTVPYLLSKRALPGMIERRFGRVISIASVAGRTGLLHGAAYAASKHGLLGFTRSLALEVAKTGVTVNAICPGPTRTRSNDQRMAYDAQRLGRSLEELDATATPLGRRIQPEEIGPLAVYLASADSAAVTGQAFNIDGGLSTP